MTEAQFEARYRKMLKTWPTLTAAQQERWAELKTDIEQMAETLHWLKGFCDELARARTQAKQLRLKEGKSC